MPTALASCCVIVLLTVAAAGARELPASMRLADRPHMTACACEDPALCAPVTKQHQREVFGTTFVVRLSDDSRVGMLVLLIR